MIEFPLPVRWEALVDKAAFLWSPPALDGDEVVVRAGHRLLAYASADGSPRWSCELGSKDRGGDVFGRAGAVWFAEITSGDERTLVGVAGGKVAWRCPLGAVIERRGAVVAGGS